MRSGVDYLLFECEAGVPLVEIGEHRFVFLGQQRHKVHPSVAIEINRHDVDAASTRIDRMSREVWT